MSIFIPEYVIWMWLGQLFLYLYIVGCRALSSIGDGPSVRVKMVSIWRLTERGFKEP